jgi:hypothetical protein
MVLSQIAYLSTRPDVLAETLDYVRHFMPWITDHVVVTPRRLRAEIAGLAPNLSVVTDEDLLGHSDLAGLDHTTRNYRLRVAMCRAGAVDEVFLCSDDDYRPLKPIEPDRFVITDPAGAEKLVGFFFYDLDQWRYETSDFDHGQHNTAQIMAYMGAGHYAYASHMPQAMYRELLVRADERVQQIAPSAAVCEWSVHGNLGRLLEADRFTEPRPYLTLGWPQYPNEWRRTIVPHEYAFENFYPDMYEPGCLYEGLPTAFDPARVEQDAVEKLMRWRRLDIAVRDLRMPRDITVPWTGHSRLRRTYFKMIRPARPTVQHLLDD